MIGQQRWCILSVTLCITEHRTCCLGFLPSSRQYPNHRHQDFGRFSFHTHLYETHRPTVAILGGDLAGVTAALTQHDCDVYLLTGHSSILGGICSTNRIPILPDTSLTNRDLIERYGSGSGSGGRELAGLLSEKCSPKQAKEWLERQGIELEEDRATSDDMSILLREKPLFVSPQCNLPEILERNLEQANVKIETNTVIRDVGYQETSFVIDRGGTKRILIADVIVLANDISEGAQNPIHVASKDGDNKKLQSKADKLKRALDFDLDGDELSRKDRTKLEKKRRQLNKKKITIAMADESDVDSLSLSTKKNRKTEKRYHTASGKYNDGEGVYEDNAADAESPDIEGANDNTIHPAGDGARALKTLDFAANLGHLIEDEAPGMFDFLVPTRGILEDCAKAVVPKARLRCKVDLSSAEGKKD